MTSTAEPAGERLQKLLAAAGLGSRRALEDWIRDGRVTINGRVAVLGERASAADRICVDGQPVAVAPVASQQQALLLYHKPLGEVTTRSDPEGRPTVFERLPAPPQGRWINVGRLDVNTTGLLLFTTDGELAHRLMHPSSELEREYWLRLRDEPDAATLRRLRSGVQLDDGLARFDRLEALAPEQGGPGFRAVLREGRNREVRRMWESVGQEVIRLHRARYGSIALPDDLRPGQSRLADPAQYRELSASAVRRERPPSRYRTTPR